MIVNETTIRQCQNDVDGSNYRSQYGLQLRVKPVSYSQL